MLSTEKGKKDALLAIADFERGAWSWCMPIERVGAAGRYGEGDTGLC